MGVVAKKEVGSSHPSGGPPNILLPEKHNEEDMDSLSSQSYSVVSFPECEELPFPNRPSTIREDTSSFLLTNASELLSNLLCIFHSVFSKETLKYIKI